MDLTKENLDSLISVNALKPKSNEQDYKDYHFDQTLFWRGEEVILFDLQDDQQKAQMVWIIHLELLEIDCFIHQFLVLRKRFKEEIELKAALSSLDEDTFKQWQEEAKKRLLDQFERLGKIPSTYSELSYSNFNNLDHVIDQQEDGHYYVIDERQDRFYSIDKVEGKITSFSFNQKGAFLYYLNQGRLNLSSPSYLSIQPYDLVNEVKEYLDLPLNL